MQPYKRNMIKKQITPLLSYPLAPTTKSCNPIKCVKVYINTAKIQKK